MTVLVVWDSIKQYDPCLEYIASFHLKIVHVCIIIL